MAALVLPSNVEAERSVLGAMLINRAAAEVALGSLTVEDFSNEDPRNRLIFKAMVDLHAHNIPIDAQTVNGQLRDAKRSDEAGGTPYLFELIDTMITPQNISQYIEMVHEQSVLRQFLIQMKKISDEFNKGVDNVGDFILRSNDSISKIAQKRTVRDMRTAKEVAEETGKRILSMSGQANNGVTGLATGYKLLDEYTHGWQKGDLIILAARPSVGKTAFGMNLAYNAAVRQKVPVAFFSLEMGATKIMERLIASASCVSNDKIQTGYLTSKEKVSVATAIDKISKTKLFFDDASDSLLGDLISKATKLKNTNPDLGLIVIDYLGRIRYSQKADFAQRQQEVSYISTALKTLARQLEVPVICLSQLNRNVEDNDDKRPTLANLRESGAIEQDADIVMLMYRPDYYTDQGQTLKSKGKKGSSNSNDEKPKEQQPAPLTPEQKERAGNPSLTTIIIAKNRNGKTGQIELMFQKSYSLFSDKSEKFEEQQAEMAAEASAGFPDGYTDD